ncbi:uncharacterized protein TNCV_4049181 [Trichonephila clavipes]|nr:uncharacterized protein TNCV_4049181 [Trichonephila clavipes]
MNTPDHVIFRWLHSQLRETRLFQVTRHDAGWRRTIRSSSLKEIILNVVADRPQSSTRAVAHLVSVSQETICRVLNENRLHLFHFQRIHALNPADYLLRLPVGCTAKCTASEFHSSCAEQLF